MDERRKLGTERAQEHPCLIAKGKKIMLYIMIDTDSSQSIT